MSFKLLLQNETQTHHHYHQFYETSYHHHQHHHHDTHPEADLAVAIKIEGLKYMVSVQTGVWGRRGEECYGLGDITPS